MMSGELIDLVVLIGACQALPHLPLRLRMAGSR
jgi:hypothetical protein